MAALGRSLCRERGLKRVLVLFHGGLHRRSLCRERGLKPPWATDGSRGGESLPM